MNKPFIFLFLSLAAGIFLTEHFIFGFIIIGSGLFYIIFNYKKNRNFIFFFLIFCAGFFYSFFKISYIPKNHIKNLNSEKDGIYFIHVTEMVEETEDRIYFNADVISIEYKNEKILNVKGKIRVTIFKNLGIKIKYGDILKIKGDLQEPPEAKSKDEFNYRKFLRYKSIYYILYAKEKDVEFAGNKTSNYFLKFSYNLKEKLIYIIYSSLPLAEAKVLEGIMLGNYRILPEEINEHFKRTGTAHILAVSGMNVGIIALIIFLILKLFKFHRKVSAIITLIFITVFAIITGADPSIIRATFMAYVILLGYIIEYEGDLLNSLAIAGFFILLVNPFELFSVSFQLSFLATFGIIYYTDFITKIFPYVTKWISEIVFATITSQIFIIPVMINTFHQVSLISVIANFFIVPVSGVVTILGFVLWILGIFSVKISVLLGGSIWLLIKIMIFIVKFLSLIPYAAISVKTINSIMLFLYYLFFVILPHNDIDIYIKKVSLKKITAISLIILFFLHLFMTKKDSYIYFPDIKNIGAAFIKTQNNKKILLIGCCGSNEVKEIKNKIVLYLRKQGINILDYLVIFYVEGRENYEIIKNNFFVKNIISNNYFDDKKIIIIENNSNFNIDKNVYLSFHKDYFEFNNKNKTFIFSGYLNNDFSDSGNKIIFSCYFDNKILEKLNLQNNIVIVNTSIIKKYYKIKIPSYIWDIQRDGRKTLFF